MDFHVVLDNLPYLLYGAYPDGPLGGAALTALLSLGSGIASAALGVALGVALAMSRGRLHAALAMVVGFFRSIPVLMLIFWTYFLLPTALGIDVPGVLSVMSALSLIGGAYLAHGVYAGIAGLGAGQMAAALSLGLRPWQALRLVVLPQALRIMLPSFVNQWVTLIKDSSLAYIVGVADLSFVAAQVNARVIIYPAEIFLFVGLIYWLLCMSLQTAAQYFARRASVHLGRPSTPLAMAPA
ncbi:amino acid ABC transporter permease [Pollutimonas bauzanensis]|uniref:Polar amino acid transport system permease protein n=1 Tax=Pollutimonas bauzanensis TaxID=658167 RepID=A0A1M5VEA8_9BURK|nr:amino acid ABC transporter permease [Pollutimonas bauzanensis]SHH73521.1 polar amino acid transport system permease protein [Pollutimonas bauzanensis]